MLGVKPAAGRFFLREEDRTPGANPVVVLGHGVWQRRFGGDRSIVGRTIRLNNAVLTVAGIAPEGFRGIISLFAPDLWIPLTMTPQLLPRQSGDWLNARGSLAFVGAGRLKSSIGMKEAEANLKTIARALELEHKEANTGRSVALRTIIQATLFPGIRETILFGGVVLMVVVGLVLLIACSNVANLLLARAVARRQEIAVRQALGAGRTRLVRQLLTESVLLSLLGGALGIALGYAGCELLWSMRPAVVADNFIKPTLDLNVVVFSFLISLVAAVGFGFVPALQATRPELVEFLKEDSRTAGRTRRRIRLANAFVVGQVALSLMSLTVAGLFLRSIQSAYKVDTGFETQKLAMLVVNPGQSGYTQARSEQLYRDIRARVSQIPGVDSVSWGANMPLWARPSRTIVIEGREIRDREDTILTFSNTVDTGYFRTMGIALTSGRDFTDADREGALPVAIINDTMAARYWPGENPIGRRLRLSGEKVTRQIAGIVTTSNYQWLGDPPKPCVFVPLRQSFNEAMVLYIRTGGPPSRVLAATQREVRMIDSNVTLENGSTIAELIDSSLWMAKFGVGLLTVFGTLALMLSSVGLYGIMAYSVNRRRREIGVRMALGASRAGVLGLVMRQGMILVVTGLVLGLIAAVGLARAVSSLLLGVSATDPISLSLASLTLIVVALVACYLPARRASRLDPVVTLREG